MGQSMMGGIFYVKNTLKKFPKSPENHLENLIRKVEGFIPRLTLEEVLAMRGKYRKVPVDVDDITIDPTASKKARISTFLRQAKNPYLMKIDGVAVEMEYTEDGPTLEEAVKQMMNFTSDDKDIC